jgi:hypothetical protein
MLGFGRASKSKSDRRANAAIAGHAGVTAEVDYLQ